MTIQTLVLIIVAVAGLCIVVYSSSLFDVRVFRKAKVRNDEIVRLVIQVGLGMLIFAGTLGLSIGLSSATATSRAIHKQVLITIAITLLCAIGSSLLTIIAILSRLYVRSKYKQRLSNAKPDPQFKEAMDEVENQIKELPNDLWITLLEWLKKIGFYLLFMLGCSLLLQNN